MLFEQLRAELQDRNAALHTGLDSFSQMTKGKEKPLEECLPRSTSILLNQNQMLCSVSQKLSKHTGSGSSS